jgi:hypothetical protein
MLRTCTYSCLMNVRTSRYIEFLKVAVVVRRSALPQFSPLLPYTRNARSLVLGLHRCRVKYSTGFSNRVRIPLASSS